MGDGKGDDKLTGKENYVVLRSDRRKFLRKQILVLKVRGEDKKGSFFGYGKTIGRGGMFIASVNPKKVGEEFDISFKLPGGGVDVRCRCVVAWQREYDPDTKHEPGMGIKFLDLANDVRDKIEEWIKKNK